MVRRIFYGSCDSPASLRYIDLSTLTVTHVSGNDLMRRARSVNGRFATIVILPLP